jgi:hypothetical protein
MCNDSDYDSQNTYGTSVAFRFESSIIPKMSLQVLRFKERNKNPNQNRKETKANRPH